VAVQNIQWRDGTCRRCIGRLGQLILGHQHTNRLQIRTGDDRKTGVSGGEKGARNSGDGFAGIGRLAGEFS
jgi:hypothetical protein